MDLRRSYGEFSHAIDGVGAATTIVSRHVYESNWEVPMELFKYNTARLLTGAENYYM